jgi:subtilase family serine protease
MYKNLVVAVKNQNRDTIRQMLSEVSDPQHPKYKGFKTRAEIESLTVNAAGIKAVHTYLKNADVKILKTSGNYILASAPVSRWEDLLQTTFHQYFAGGMKAHSAESYTVPAAIVQHVHEFFGVIDKPISRISPKWSSASASSSSSSASSGQAASGSTAWPTDCGLSGSDNSGDGGPCQASTPQHLSQYYGVPEGANCAGNNVSQGIFESGSLIALSDLRQFDNTLKLPWSNVVDGECSGCSSDFTDYSAGGEATTESRHMRQQSV